MSSLLSSAEFLSQPSKNLFHLAAHYTRKNLQVDWVDYRKKDRENAFALKTRMGWIEANRNKKFADDTTKFLKKN